MVAIFKYSGMGLLLWACAGADASAEVRPQEALVVVTSRGSGESVINQGIVIGDGSLVVMGDRGVFDTPDGRRRHLSGCLTVASPYLGDVTDAEVVAFDANMSLAVLRIPWRGHPALALAPDRSILNTEQVAVIGMPAVIEMLAGKRQPRVDLASPFAETTWPVDYVAVREGRPLFVRVQAADSVDWGVAPMLLPGTHQVAALALAQFKEGREGMVLNRLEGLAELLRGSAESDGKMGAKASRDQAPQAWDLYVQIWDLERQRRREERAAQCRKFIELRPRCFYGYMHAAEAAEQLGRTEEAERLYQEAVTHAPESFTARVAQARFLQRRGRPAEAVPIYESLWSHVSQRPYLALGLSEALTKMQEPARCCRFLEEALAVDPNEGALLIRLGNSRNALREYGAAADAFGKAAELLPEHESVRAHCARNLELAGCLEEAEIQYRKAVTAHPGCEFARHSFASFLAQHRPACRQEALKEAGAALRLQESNAGDRAKIERLIRDLEARGP